MEHREKVAQRKVGCSAICSILGEINDSQKAAWTKVTEVFDHRRLIRQRELAFVSGGGGGAGACDRFTASWCGWISLS